jgi:hypothetical protein
LKHLTAADASTIVAYGGLGDSRLSTVASLSSRPIAEVDEIVRRVLAFDLQDFELLYDSASTSLNTVIQAPFDVAGLFEDFGSREKWYFMLYDESKCWDANSGLLCDVLIEDSIDDDQTIYLSVAHFFVKNKLAFKDSIELLTVSSRENWPKWRELWRYF